MSTVDEAVTGVGDLLAVRVVADPHGVAAVDLAGERLTVAELDRASAEVAEQLDGLDEPPGAVLAALPNCLAAMVAAFAVFRSRHALVMPHPALPAPAMRALVHRLAPVALLEADGAAVVPRPGPVAPAALWTPPADRPDLGLALCVPTSGSTGEPKVIAAPHRQVLSAVAAIGARLGYRPGDVVAAVPPLSFDYGLYQLLLAVAGGATVLLDPRVASVQGLSVAIARAGVTVLPVVPPMLRAMVSARATRRLDTGRVRLVTTTGDLLTESDVDQTLECFPQAEILPMYGLSECKRVAITAAGTDRPAGAVGLPLDGTDTAVVADDGSLPAGSDVDGELVVAGPHLTLGYLGDRAATTARFGVDGRAGVRILRTGDRLRQDEDGWLHWVGRGTELIKTAGYRLSPAELESAAAVSGVVAEAGAYGRPDHARGQVPVLVVRLRQDTAPARDTLNAALRTRLPAWALPDLDFRDDPLPRTPHGKIDRKRLAASDDVSTTTAAPGTREPPAAASPLPPGLLTDLPAPRQLISCHTQALLCAYPPPYELTAAEVELVTSLPFGVRCVPDDPKRLLIPFLDPDLGLDRAAALLGRTPVTHWYRPGDADRATARLDHWLRTGPVVLGPVDLGALPYHEVAGTVRGYDHYLVALGRDADGGIVVRDPEGFVQVTIAEADLRRAWAATGVLEGRGAFTLRRLVTGAAVPDALPALGRFALDNLVAAGDECDTTGPGAYRALATLAPTPAHRRSLSLQLPTAAYRYLIAARLATHLADHGEMGWADLSPLISDQADLLARMHSALCRSGLSPSLFTEAAEGEQRLLDRAVQLKGLVPT